MGLLAGHLAAAEDEVLVATDGAYLAGEHHRWRAASWAVAVGEHVVSGLVEGEERMRQANVKPSSHSARRSFCREGG